MGSNLREAGEGFSELGENIAPLSAGLVAVGGASVMASDNINSAMNNFKTKLGASGADLAKYQGVMDDVAKTGVGSFDEVSNAVVTVGQNMKGLSTTELTGLTEESMQLAEVMGTDVPEVSKVAGQLMTQFGVNGATAMDLIAKGYQNGMDYAGDYMDTLNEYSVSFKSLGFGAEDMFNVLAEGVSKGAFNLDKVGDAVKEFNIRAKDGSDTTNDAFTSLGFNAEKMQATFAKGGDGAKKAYAQVVQALSGVDDQAERNRIGVELFGTQYEDMEKDVIASTGTIVDHMKNVEGASAEVAQNNVDFGQQMQGAWNQIQIAIKPVGDVIRGAILDIMPSVVSAIQGMSNAFTNMSPVMQKVTLAVGAFVAFLPAILIGIGGFLSVASTIPAGVSAVAKGFELLGTAGTKLIGGFKKIGTAFNALRLLLLSNPWILVAVAVVAVVALIIMNWDKVKAVTIAVFTAIGNFFKSVWSGFTGIVSSVAQACVSAWNSFSSGFMSVLSSIGSFFKSVWSGLVSFFSGVWNGLVSIVSTVFSAVSKVVSTAFSVIKTIVLVAVGVLAMMFIPIYNAFASVWNALVDVAKVVWSALKAGVSAYISFVKAYFALIKAIWSAVWNAVVSVAKSVFNTLKSVIMTIVSVAQTVGGKIKSFFQTAWNAVAQVVQNVISKVKGIIQGILTTISPVTSKIKSLFTTAWNAVANLVKSVISRIKTTIQSIIAVISSVGAKVKSVFSSAWNAVSSLVQSIISRIKNTIQGLAQTASSVGSKVKSVFTSAWSSISSKVSGVISSIKSKISSIWSTASGVASKIKSAFSGLFKGIKVPSFSMGGWTPKDLPKMPKMSVAWHAKGGILDSSTLIGAGEKGAESIVPLSSQRRMAPFAQAVAKFMPEDKNAGGSTEINIAQLVVREEADVNKIAQQLNKLQGRKERARGGLSFNG
ncbi:phage tail tape measure protein [Priestia megaterium]